MASDESAAASVARTCPTSLSVSWLARSSTAARGGVGGNALSRFLFKDVDGAKVGVDGMKVDMVESCIRELV